MNYFETMQMDMGMMNGMSVMCRMSVRVKLHR